MIRAPRYLCPSGRLDPALDAGSRFARAAGARTPVWPLEPPRAGHRAPFSPRSAAGRETTGPRSWAVPPPPTAPANRPRWPLGQPAFLRSPRAPHAPRTRRSRCALSRCAARRRRTVASRSRSDASTRRATPPPHGFEGMGELRELVHANDEAVAERVDVIEAGGDLNPASATAPSQADRHNDAFAPVHELLGHHLVVVPFGLPTRQALPNRIVSLRRQLLDRVPDDAGIGVRQRLVDVDDDQEPANDLHVLRHRAQYPACW